MSEIFDVDYERIEKPGVVMHREIILSEASDVDLEMLWAASEQLHSVIYKKRPDFVKRTHPSYLKNPTIVSKDTGKSSKIRAILEIEYSDLSDKELENMWNFNIDNRAFIFEKRPDWVLKAHPEYTANKIN